MSPPHHRRQKGAAGFGSALGLSFGLMALVAIGIADSGVALSAVVLGSSALAIGVLYRLFPRGPQFALGTANGLAMYACLYAVLGQAGFPDAPQWMRCLAFMLPILAFVVACWRRRAELSAFAEEEADLAHLPRFARWLGVIGLVGAVSLSLPVNRMGHVGEGLALLSAMASIALISAIAVGDVVRLLVDIAVIFRTVTLRLTRLAVPIAAYSSLWALLSVVFGCLYRIADGVSNTPMFNGLHGPLRMTFSDAMHFSVVTLSTVGYGDIQPADDGIRVLASIQILMGQLLLLFGFYEIMRGSRAGGPDGVESAPRHAAPAHVTPPPGPAHAMAPHLPASRRAPAGE